MAVKIDGKGLRKDDGKPRPDLFPPDALLMLAQLYARGAVKYAPRNYERGMPYSKVLGPLMRHLLYWMAGEERDPETKIHHMVHVAWNGLALACYEMRGLHRFDDRNKLDVKKLRALVEEVEVLKTVPLEKRRKK